MGNLTPLHSLYFIVRDSFGFVRLAFGSRLVWIGVLMLICLGIWQRWRNASHTGVVIVSNSAQWAIAICSLAVVPMLLSTLAYFSWPVHNVARPYERIRIDVATALIYFQYGLAAFLVWRQRRQFAPTLLIVSVAVLWALGAGFVASMAITNQWL